MTPPHATAATPPVEVPAATPGGGAPVDPTDPQQRPAGAWQGDVALWLGCLTAYLLTATTTLQGMDSSEWVSLMVHGGVAHPPGYPFYGLLLRLFGLLPLPIPAPAQAAALSAVLMATAVLVLARALEERNGHVPTTRISAVAFALSLPVWRLGGLAEVTALLCLNAALLLHAAQYIENEEFLTPLHGAWLGALLGLGVAAHHSVVLVVPMVLFHIVRAHHQAGLLRWVLAVGAGLLAGTVVLAACWGAWLAWPGDGHGPFWVEIRSLETWWHHVLRRDYGTLAAAQNAGGWSIVPSLTLGLDLLRAFHLLIPLGLAAAVQTRRGWACLGCLVLAGPGFLGLLTTTGPGGVEAFHMEFRERFHALPMMLFAVLTHDALASLAYQLPRLRRTVFARAQLGLLLLVMGVSALTTLPAASWKGETATQDVLTLAVRAAPKDALVFLAGDAVVTGWRPAEALANVDGSQRAVLAVRDLVYPTGDPLTAQLLKTHCKSMPCTQQVLLDALLEIRRTGRPVVFFPASAVDSVLPGLPVVLDGLLARLEEQVPTPAQQLPVVQAALNALVLPGPLEDARRTAEGQARAFYIHPLVVLTRRARAAGDTATAATAEATAKGMLKAWGLD